MRHASNRLEIPVVVETTDGARSDLLIDAVPDAPGAAVARSLAASLDAVGANGLPPLTCLRTGRLIDPEQPIAAAGLLRGDVILLGNALSEKGELQQSADRTWLAVVGGPSSGRKFGLRAGQTVVGREPADGIAIPDASLSIEHLAFRVAADGAVTVTDLGSRNGATLDGVRLNANEEQQLSAGAVVRAGRTLLSIGQERAEHSQLIAGVGGMISHNRPPRVNRPFVADTIALDAPPAKRGRARLPLAASLMPVLIGVVLWRLTHSTTMLAFSALTPALAIASFVEDRHGGKRGYRGKAEQFRQSLLDARRRLDESWKAEATARRLAYPSLPDLLDRISRVSPTLWERRPANSDFLQLRLGSSDQPSGVQVELAPGGDEPLRGEAGSLIDWYSVAPEVPFTVSLPDVGAVAVIGSDEATAGVARSLALQTAALHSPADVAIAAALPVEQRLEWEFLKWLPHTGTEIGLDRQLALGRVAARELVGALIDLSNERLTNDVNARGPASSLPWIVLVLDEQVAPERALVSRLLAGCSAAGIAVIWIGRDRRQIPGECGGIVELDASVARLVFTDVRSGHVSGDVTADMLEVELALAAARSLAPVEDASSARGTSRIPRTISLSEVLEAPAVDGPTLVERWESDRGLSMRIGSLGEMPLELDLRRDGPHALVAGTTGAGKSELLQTLIAALAATHPPTRVTFLLVDYKGGAAFKDCVQLPHTVGFVTDLDEHLARRALVSLNAELRRRERVLATVGAKDVLELQRRDPQAAPPALVIVIDEFATLAKEVPEFVQGVVDVAQRGRSLGVHLILATQRPGGVVTDNIRANTNLRIALRVAAAAESTDVIGVPDAVSIPRSRPGRGYARTGETELVEFQTAFVGAALPASSDSESVVIREFDFGEPHAVNISRSALMDADATELHAVVAAAGDAVGMLGLEPPARPWLPPLGERISLESLPQPAGPSAAAIGLADEPARQLQRPFVIDLEDVGSLLVYGTGGSGKTTVLRTLVTALAERLPARDLHVYGIDFGSRSLAMLEELPHCGSVVPGEDEERVERLFTYLRRTIERRKEQFGRAGVFGVDEFRRTQPDQEMPRILVLLDSYAAFANAFEQVNLGELLSALPRLVSDGPAVGIHFAITSDRRGSVPGALAGIVPLKIVLRMADEDEYGALGLDLRAIRGATLPPGRAFVDGGLEMQTAIVSAEPRAEAQAAAISELGRRLSTAEATRAPAIRPLPAEISVSELPPPSQPLEAPLGLADSDLTSRAASLADAHFLVVGPYRSGRTTTLRRIAEALRAGDPTLDLCLLAARRSALVDLPIWTSTARGIEECDRAAAELAARVERRTLDGDNPPLVIVVDDGDELADTPGGRALETIVRRGRDLNARIVAAGERQAVHRAFSGWLREIRKDESGILLNPDLDVDGDILGVRLPRRSNLSFPPGRGFLIKRGVAELTQVARTV